MNTSLQTGTASFADEGGTERCWHNDAWAGPDIDGKSHQNSLTVVSTVFSSTKRETMWEANEQMFK